mmetsp:Transcript_9360/g.25431  ORF Transcript_9360/g.25431 Transcript_9360/m.25431 type:complete len:81 (-) Transcript_9360:361-603(-)
MRYLSGHAGPKSSAYLVLQTVGHGYGEGGAAAFLHLINASRPRTPYPAAIATLFTDERFLGGAEFNFKGVYCNTLRENWK